MPILFPPEPTFASYSEQKVWDALVEQLGPDDLLVANLRITDRKKDHELDLVVAFADGGVAVVEVKGSKVWADDEGWWQEIHGRPKAIDPVGQARSARYALRDWVTNDPRWGSRGRIRWSHAVVLPYTRLPDGFERIEAPRWLLHDKRDLATLAERLRDGCVRQEVEARLMTADDVYAVRDTLTGRMAAQRDLIGEAAEREDAAERMTEQQATILNAIRHLDRVEIRGGAGSGKTWMAMEKARRLTRDGARVALICYSRGLAAWMQRRVATFEEKDRPAYVGTFHNLAFEWGVAIGDENDPHFWEVELPAAMVEAGTALAPEDRFDAVVIDEAQDFADRWWPAVDAALLDSEGGLFVFTDEGQQVFSRYGGLPPGLVPLVLDANLRNTRQIAETFSTLAPIRMRLAGTDGPEVRFVECPADEALRVADDQVDRLLDEGWRPRDVALLTTGSRHPEQVQRQGMGQDVYWDSFYDTDQVFYGHVLGFKGLERSVVVLAINEVEPRDRSRERLYVGLSRARDQLVVCGDPAHIASIGGAEVLERLSWGGAPALSVVDVPLVRDPARLR